MTLDMTRMRRMAEIALEQYDPQTTARYVKTFCGQEVNCLLEQADALLENRFTFCDRWDMEPCRTPYTVEPGQWTQSPNGDPEWVFMLNRQDYLPKLLQAAVLTGEKKYTRKLVALVMDWIASNPITGEGTSATRTIDTGIRCMNWCGLLPFLLADGALGEEETERMLHSLSAQFVNLRRRYQQRYTLSNWGVLQTTAICAGYAWLSDFLPQGLEDWAWAELRTQLRLQILEDGVHWEQSPLYHVEVLNACTNLLVQLRRARQAGHCLCAAALQALEERPGGREVQAGPGEGLDFETRGWLERAVRVMSRHVLYTADPAFYQLPQCDSDVTEVRDVLARAAALLEDAAPLRWGAGDRLDMQSAFLLGAPGIAAFEARTAAAPLRRSWYCPRAGQLALRSAWSPEANFTAVKNSPLGSSHGHADQTHLTLYYQGIPFLVDSGRYTYREDDPLRVALKAPAAHNVCVIDGQSGGTPDGSWNYADYAETGPNFFAEQENVHYAELPFHGTLRDGTPYRVTRRLLVLDEGIWLSVQDVVCPGQHQVEEYFHLHPAVQVEPGDTNCLLKQGDARLKLWHAGNLTPQKSVFSPQYNAKQPSTVLVRTAVMQDRWTESTLFTPDSCTVCRANVYQAGNAQPLPAEVVSAWEIRAGNDRVWTLLVWNRENFRGAKVFTCQGQPIYGKVLALCAQGGKNRMIRLK